MPELICVGGVSSGVGKTSVACLLLRSFPGWAAIKVTPCRPEQVCPLGDHCGSCEPPDGPYEIVTDREILSADGKDTALFIEAGASRVAWVRAIPQNLPEALEVALSEFADVHGVIVESTTAIPMIDGLRILVAREGTLEVKESARNSLNLADIIAVNLRRPTESLPALPFTSPGEVVPVYANLAHDNPLNRRFLEACGKKSLRKPGS